MREGTNGRAVRKHNMVNTPSARELLDAERDDEVLLLLSIFLLSEERLLIVFTRGSLGKITATVPEYLVTSCKVSYSQQHDENDALHPHTKKHAIVF